MERNVDELFSGHADLEVWRKVGRERRCPAGSYQSRGGGGTRGKG